MKYVLLILLALTIISFLWSGYSYVSGRSPDEQIGALAPFAIGCLFGVAFLVALIGKAIFS